MRRILVLLVALSGCDSADAPAADGSPETPDGGGVAADAPPSSCDALDLGACRLRADCAADTCFECSCEPVFHGCRAVAAAPYDCPELGCPQPLCCRAQTDCVDSTSCLPPGTPIGCGICNPDPGDCTMDPECPPTQICEPIQCTCDGARACAAGCTATSCGAGEECNPTTYRCQPAACDGETDCPPNFGCGELGCTRTTCAADAECVDGGFCVEGRCYDTLGECVPPVP